MRILIVASYNHGCYAPFILEQAEAVRNQGLVVAFYGVKGKGLWGYLRNFSLLKKELKAFRPDVIHAHYGLSGLLANLQRKVPVVTTYHGSDINDQRVLPFSKAAMWLSAWNIFVSQKTARPNNKRFSLLPCGIDLCALQLTEKNEARRQVGLEAEKRYILFAGSFDNPVKNSALAKEAVAMLRDNNVELLELKGYTREEVTLLMCAVDALLLTSLSEGSPQVIKEALACGCPIVSADVGDVKERIDGVAGCYLAETNTSLAFAELLSHAFLFSGKTEGRKRIIDDGLTNVEISKRVLEVYKMVSKGS